MPRPPDPMALRRDRRDDPTWTKLTEADPDAPVPEFPLASPSPRVLHWWEHHWRTPQAAQWAKGREHVTVALFCQVLTEAEKPNAPVTIPRPLKQLRDELGLSVDGLRRRRWLMPDETAPVNTAPASVTPLRPGRDAAGGGSGTGHRTSRERFRQLRPNSTPAVDPDDDPAPF